MLPLNRTLTSDSISPKKDYDSSSDISGAGKPRMPQTTNKNFKKILDKKENSEMGGGEETDVAMQGDKAIPKRPGSLFDLSKNLSEKALPQKVIPKEALPEEIVPEKVFPKTVLPEKTISKEVYTLTDDVALMLALADANMPSGMQQFSPPLSNSATKNAPKMPLSSIYYSQVETKEKPVVDSTPKPSINPFIDKKSFKEAMGAVAGFVGESSEPSKPSKPKTSFSQLSANQTNLAYMDSTTWKQSAMTNSITPDEMQKSATPHEIGEIIEQIVDKTYTMQAGGQTDTVVILKHPPIFEGATIVISAFDSAQKEFNISFQNLTPEAQQLLDANRSQLKSDLEQKGFTIHIITTTTVPIENLYEAYKPSAEGEKQREQGQNSQGQEQQKQREQNKQKQK